ncbi:lysozyme inhibitor LprI family protein [Xanthomonas campestris]|uniref:lysozyme inhibitor LprI family protein n=1 Tax=Xanthomonas campestris TaxID=339 RepID=UPI002B3A206D|nr:lysozyme inhibitor LprI family protein [Xanthomonas campestris]
MVKLFSKHLALSVAGLLLLGGCKKEVSLEKTAISNVPNQTQDLDANTTKAVSKAESPEEIKREQKRIAREQDQLLENALNGETQQQRGELAKSAQLRASYVQCVNNSDAVHPALMECNGKEYEYQDARLNKVYRRLLDKLPADEKLALKQEERDWIKRRDALCQSNGALGGGQAEELEDSSCELNATAKRAEELEKR